MIYQAAGPDSEVAPPGQGTVFAGVVSKRIFLEYEAIPRQPCFPATMRAVFDMDARPTRTRGVVGDPSHLGPAVSTRLTSSGPSSAPRPNAANGMNFLSQRHGG